MNNDDDIVMMSKESIDSSGESATAVKERVITEPPHKYNIVMHNDDFTPMGFVVEILVGIYNKERPDAINIMLKIHNEGKSIVGTYTKCIPETKLLRTHEVAEKEGYSQFKVTMEKA